MPDESCRKCGGGLKKYALCAACRKVTQQICIICGLLTADSLHVDCFYDIDLIQVTHSLVHETSFEHALA